MPNKLKALSLNFLIALSSSLYSGEGISEGELLAQTARPSRKTAEQPEPMQPGYNQTTRYDQQNCRSTTFFVTGNFTYWQPSQNNMELGTIGNLTSALDVINGTLVNMDFGFKPGFQVGAGIGFPPDNWDVYVEYTWFRGTNTKRTSLDTSNFLVVLYPAWEVPNAASPTYFSGNERWKLRMDLIDAQLGRCYYVGQKLTFRPFIGLRAPWIRQKLRVVYGQNTVNPLVDTQITQFSHSWGIGPRIGMELNWLFGCGISMYGKGGADIVYTSYTKLHFKQQSVIGDEVQGGSRYIFNQNHLNTVRPHLDLALGLRWGTSFWNNCGQFSLSADYGFQVFFDQNMFRNFVDDTSLSKSIAPNGNLYMQGLTISLRADF